MRRHWSLQRLGFVLLAAAAAALCTVSVLLHRSEPYLRARIVQELQDRFHARVELDSFHVSLVDGLRAEGKGLRIWPPAQVEGVTVPGPVGQGSGGQGTTPDPLIRLEEFRFHAPLVYAPGRPIHISLVELKGLEIHVPPRSHFGNPAAGGMAGTAKDGQRVPKKPGAGWSAGLVTIEKQLSFDVETIECKGAHLVVETSKPGKLPLEFAIAHLKLTGLAADESMKFDAELTNPRPVGTIYATGSFGALHAADIGEAPIQGTYRFEHADLASFKGIAGILHSTGRYQGTLRELVVDGETQTPDFRLTHFGNALPLTTRFHARVDGTNGDTWLEPVEATLGHSHFWVQGQVVRVTEKDDSGALHSIGHNIDLKVNVDRGQMADFMRLASRGATPLLTGGLTMKTALHIPPGPVPVHERLRLQGSFVLDQALFTSEKIQAKLLELSLRGQGRPQDVKTTDPASVRSAMHGNFLMGGGVITLPALEFTVPGADIQLKGTYGLEGGALDFAGTAKLEATVSQMVGGWKGLLLKPADRFFKKDGAGTSVPIHISGTRTAPKFGIGLDTMKGTRPERLGEKP
ncbi:MAG: hypothetical protein P4K86_08220 [Terracidiphilus sp.]|nr:hypothetical protein [Terracidiphilus sp.]MDR3776541.1 hypothetical protein [Terracidiphilus sp.]